MTKVVLLTAALLALPAPASPPDPPPDPSKGSAAAGQAGYDVKWHDSWDAALAAARKLKDGRILVELVDDDCGECQRMEALIAPATSFYAFMRDKVAVQLNRKSKDGKRFAERFGVDRTPAFFVLTPDEVVCGFQVGPTSQEGWFATFAEAERSWGAYKRKLADEERSPEDLGLSFQVAQETYKRRGDGIAEPRFRRIASSPDARADHKEQSLAYLASIYLDSHRVEEAVKALDSLLAIAQDPVLKERAEIRRAEVEIARGRKDLAVARLRDFKKAHPESPRLSDVDELLRALSTSTSGEARKER